MLKRLYTTWGGALISSLLFQSATTRVAKLSDPMSFYGLEANTLDGKPFDFGSLKGKTVLVSNTACGCGYTKSNFKDLVELHKKYRSEGFEVLAFPSNDFGRQESGTPEEIQDFVDGYGVEFTMMEKSEVNGPNQHPVFAFLKQATQSADQDIAWNFETKFLIDAEAKTVTRFSKAFDTKQLEPEIKSRLPGRSEL